MTERRKRSSKRGTTAGDRPQPNETREYIQGVGGRQPDPDPARRGGGYLDVCTESGVDVETPDPRLSELRAIGIRRTWVRVAEVVGFDKFLQVWRVLSEDQGVQDERGRVYVPSITQFFRYQRNRLILSLAEEGADPAQIRQVVADQLREQVSEKHIQRILSSGNN